MPTVQTINVGTKPQGIVSDGIYIWVCNRLSNTVSKIDPTDNSVIATISVGIGPFTITYGGGFIWVVNFIGNSVSKIDPTTDTVVNTITGITEGLGCGFAGGFVWIASYTADGVYKINAVTNAMTTIYGGSWQPYGVIIADGFPWIQGFFSKDVRKLDPVTNAILVDVDVVPFSDFYRPASCFTEFAFDGTSIWFGQNYASNRISCSKINIHTNVVAKFPNNDPPFSNSFAFDGTYMWTERSDGNVYKLDISTGDIVETVEVGSAVYGYTHSLLFAFNSVWVSNPESHTVSRILLIAPPSPLLYPQLERSTRDLNRGIYSGGIF